MILNLTKRRKYGNYNSRERTNRRLREKEEKAKMGRERFEILDVWWMAVGLGGWPRDSHSYFTLW
jgi:hypothetical protein